MKMAGGPAGIGWSRSGEKLRLGRAPWDELSVWSQTGTCAEGAASCACGTQPLRGWATRSRGCGLRRVIAVDG